MMGKRKIGQIKALLKGFGFIQVDNENDVFFHFSKLKSGISQSQLNKGAKVSFLLEPGQKGDMVAVDVSILDSHLETPSCPVKNCETDQYFMPFDTIKHVINDFGRQNIENFDLFLNRCAPFDVDQKKFILSRKKTKDKPGYNIQYSFKNFPFQEINDRHKKAIENIVQTLKGPLKLKLEWRMTLGLGNESVYETALTLHHIYGIPYIPGQAVKGIARNWIIKTRFKNEAGALKDQGFCDIFGCPPDSFYKQARAGRVLFFDAYPVSLAENSIQADIMNPHYGPYYSEGKPPADYHNPVPVNFLTVKNTVFELYMGMRQNKTQNIETGLFKNRNPLTVANEFISSALTDHGIGAKTSAGYGYFNILK